MTLELWVYWGMLGSLGVGYLLGRRSRQGEVTHWRRIAERWCPDYHYHWDAAGGRFFQEAVDAEAVERLLREIR